MTISANQMPFGDVLEAAVHLTLEEQRELVAILQRRLAERGRKQIIRDVHESRQKFLGGGCQPTTPEELMNEIGT